MPMFIVLVAVFLAGMAYSFFPHWSAYLTALVAAGLLYLAYRTRVEDRMRKKAQRRSRGHPRTDKGAAPKPLNPDPRAGDDTTLQF